MKIGIEVNGVLRDTIGKLTQVYQKNFIDVYDEEFVDPTYELDMSGNTELTIQDNSFKYGMELPVNSLDIPKYFKFKNEEEQFSFMYEDFAMEIFGHAGSSETFTFNDLNNLYLDLRDNHEIVIISDEIGKSKPATLFFLSKFGCLSEKIIFYNDFTKEEILNSFDYLVTSNPNTIINYRNKTMVVKYETEYNKNLDHPNTIKSIPELKQIINA